MYKRREFLPKRKDTVSDWYAFGPSETNPRSVRVQHEAGHASRRPRLDKNIIVTGVSEFLDTTQKETKHNN